MIIVDYLDIRAITDNLLHTIQKQLPLHFKTKVSGEKIFKKQSILGRYLLYKVLVEENHTKLSDIIFKENTYGKLSCENSFLFNISHSGSYVVLAHTHTKNSVNMGIDIEKHRSISNIDLMLNYFTLEEKQALSHLSTDSFFKIWTKKEAFYKAIGTGIYKNNSLKNVNCLHNAVFHSQKTWHFQNIPIHKEYSCYCVTNEPMKIKLRAINYQNI